MAQDITNTIVRFFEAVDSRDWTGAEALMSDPFHLDYSSFGAGPAADMKPADILAGWKGFLPGFDATQHQLGPLDITVDADTARVRTCVSASHFIGGADDGALWTVVGTYDIALMRSRDWQLSALTFNFKFQHGNLRLPQVAQGRASS
jgi:hypothetical protein